MNNFAVDLKEALGEIEKMLLEKNRNYGDSALDPIRIFSQADPVEQLKVRIDDKLSRLMRGKITIQEDNVGDLSGYLVLLKIAEKREKRNQDQVMKSHHSQ